MPLERGESMRTIVELQDPGSYDPPDKGDYSEEKEFLLQIKPTMAVYWHKLIRSYQGPRVSSIDNWSALSKITLHGVCFTN